MGTEVDANSQLCRAPHEVVDRLRSTAKKWTDIVPTESSACSGRRLWE
jgi:hypothetical protein